MWLFGCDIMNNLEFKSEEELYNRLIPALNSKIKLLNKDGYSIKKEDLWNYFSKVWILKDNLKLSDMVDDILNTDNNLIIKYLINDRRDS